MVDNFLHIILHKMEAGISLNTGKCFGHTMGVR